MADTDPDQLDSGQRSGPVGLVELDPRVALRPGRVDPFALWTVYLLRKSFLPLLFLSAIVLSLSGREGETLDDVDTPGEFLSAVESPLVVLVIAITARLLATVLAFALAYPLSHRASMVITTHQGKRAAYGRWMDRLHVTRAYRSLRWTKAVRSVASDRLEDSARWFKVIERGLTWSFPVLIVGSLIAHALAGT